MNHIALRVNNLSFEAGNEKLRHISFFLLEDKITAFTGLNYSGNALLVRILMGNENFPWHENNVYIHNRIIYSNSEIRKYVYHISGNRPVVKSWTVFEFLELTRSSWIITNKSEVQMKKQAARLFNCFNFSIDLHKKMGDLSELEKRAVALAGMLRESPRILIIDDECEGMTDTDIHLYSSMIHNALQNKIACILLSHSDRIYRMLADECMIFRKGRIVKYCSVSELNQLNMSAYLIGNTLINKIRKNTAVVKKASDLQNIVYEVDHVNLSIGLQDYKFHKGEISAIIILDNIERQRVFNIVSGRNPGHEAKYFISNRPIHRSIHFPDFLHEKICSIENISGEDELLENMTVTDNLLIPSINKISNLEYIYQSGNLTGMLQNDLKSSNDGAASDEMAFSSYIRNLDFNDRIKISLERWLLFRPKVLVLLDPIAGCDAYGTSLVLSYITKFANMGTSVILLKSNLETVENISDQIYLGQ